MIPCPYCGGSPYLRLYKIHVPDLHQSLYRITCTRCGASTEDSVTKGSARTKWERGDIMKMTVVEDEREIKRYTEIDGRILIVDGCGMCPYVKTSDDSSVYCDYPWSDITIRLQYEEWTQGKIADGCPLKEAKL